MSTKETRVQIRTTFDEKKRLIQAAKADKKTISDYLRQFIPEVIETEEI